MPFGKKSSPNCPLDGFRQLEKVFIHAFHLFSDLIHPGGVLGSGRFTVRPVKASGADQMHHGAALYAAFCWAANAYKWFEVFISAFCKFVSAVACSSHW